MAEDLPHGLVRLSFSGSSRDADFNDLVGYRQYSFSLLAGSRLDVALEIYRAEARFRRGCYMAYCWE